MTYGFVMDVPAPIEFYDALHAEVTRRGGRSAEGLLVHLGRATATGFQVLEVWESREECERFTAEVVRPALVELSGDQPPPPDPPTEEFEPRGLVIPGAAVVV